MIFSSGLFIKEAADVCLLTGDAAQGTDPFDLVIETISLAVPSFLIQYNSLVLRNEESRIGFSELW